MFVVDVLTSVIPTELGWVGFKPYPAPNGGTNKGAGAERDLYANAFASIEIVANM